MSRARIVTGLVAAAAAVMVVLLGGVARDRSAGAAQAPLAGQREALQSGFAAGDTRATIHRLRAEVEASPKNLRAWGLLGLAYQQRARETGDARWYSASERALRQALRLDADDLTATSALASLELSRHRFREALALGRRAQRIAPASARTYGILGDALVELGRYREGFAAFERMVETKPSMSSYARYSYRRELVGDRAGAVKWMRAAVEAAGVQPEPVAWARVHLGKLYWGSGDLQAAIREYEAALAAYPGYVYALDALADAEGARGRYERAIRLSRRAVAKVPDPHFVAGLSDLYRVSGRERLADRQAARALVLDRKLRESGMNTDLEVALAEADGGADAVALARRARAARPSIEGDDVLGWALARAGRCAEGRRYSQLALRLGTVDALKFFHRGMIERCLGDDREARRWLRRALAANPHFSLIWAPEARRILASLA